MFQACNASARVLELYTWWSVPDPGSHQTPQPRCINPRRATKRGVAHKIVNILLDKVRIFVIIDQLPGVALWNWSCLGLKILTCDGAGSQSAEAFKKGGRLNGSTTAVNSSANDWLCLSICPDRPRVS